MLLGGIPGGEDSLPQTLAVNGGQGKHVAGQRARGVRTRDLLGLPKSCRPEICSSQERTEFSCTDHQFSSILKAAPYCSRYTHFSPKILFVLICCPQSNGSGEIIYILHQSSNYSLRAWVSNIFRFSSPARCWTEKIHLMSMLLGFPAVKLF